MVTRNELFRSRFMNASNIEHPTVVTIAFAKMEVLENAKGESDEKLVVYFSDHQQNLALNGVNFDSIVDISGEEDSDRWPETKIEIYRTMTEVAGKPTPCIRVRAPNSEGAVGATRRPIAKPTVSSGPKKPLREEMDDEIPFN